MWSLSFLCVVLIAHGVQVSCQVSTFPPELSTAQPSCRYNCGYYMGSCSCSSNCRYYGTCCSDYYDYCSTTSQATDATTEPDTSAQPSCYYNCGYHMGSCSCTSNCRYYGTCCSDYYDYCQTSTTYAPIVTTSAQPSCRYNCGYYMGSCSCSSSCHYYGNCCYDYSYYCSATTPVATVKPCGGELFGSGTLSSPNHPNHYQDNTYCSWRLQAAYDQRVFLAIRYLELENCCSCDYIEVFDGPSNHYASLGKVCNGTLKAFYSSSNYMTVVFRTDSSVIARGFNAEFISSLKPSSGQVSCSSDHMNIVIQRSYLNSLGYDNHDLYLNSQYCRPTVDSYRVVFSFPLNSCGNVRHVDNGRVVYTNSLRNFNRTDSEITRQSVLKLNVTCIMDQDSLSQNMYVVQQPGNSSIIGTGRFNTSLTFYTSSGFYYPVTAVPYYVELNDYMYAQVDLTGDNSNLVIFLDTCVASPSPNDFHTRAYYLVRNGCTADNTYYSYISGTRSYARFRFKSFQFLRASESVYLQCKVLICQAYDYNSRCRRGCARRKARGLSAGHDTQTLVWGPIKLKEPVKQEEGTDQKDQA